MEALILAPLVLLISLGFEFLKLKLEKTTVDREAIFAREHKNCLYSYVLLAALWTYFLAAGRSIEFPILATFFTTGTHMGAWLWKDQR